MHVENIIGVLFGHFMECLISGHSSVVDNDIYLSEVIDSTFDYCFWIFHRITVVHGLTSCIVDLSNDFRLVQIIDDN